MTTVAPVAPHEDVDAETTPAPTSRFGWGLLAIGVLALAVRVANVVWWRPLDQSCRTTDGCFAINGDALYSHLQGELFAQGHGFASSFSYYFFGDIQPGAGDPPLYVLWLGWISALHGSGGTGARLLGLVLLVGAVSLAWWFGRRGGDARRVPVAAAITAGAAALLLTFSVLPGLGDGSAGVARPTSTSDSPTVQLPDGETVAQAAVIDLAAVNAHRLGSTLAGAVGVMLLGLVARRLGGDRAGLVAAGLGALYPLLWINDAMVLSESLYVPMIALVMLAAYRFWDEPDTANVVLLGAAIALAGLTRAEALLLGPLVVGPLVWGRRDRLGGLGGAFAKLAAAGAVVVVLIAPWLAYNLARFEEPTFMTAGTGAVLSAGSCDVAYDGEYVGYYGANCYQQYVDAGWTTWPDPTAEESVRDVPSRENATRYIRENIAELPRVSAFRVARMWQGYQTSQGVRLDYGVEGRGKWASWAGFWFYLALLPLAIAGTWIVHRRRLPISPLVAPAVVVSLTAALTFGVTRYRVPADAALVVAAGVAVDAALRRWSRRRPADNIPSAQPATGPAPVDA